MEANSDDLKRILAATGQKIKLVNKEIQDDIESINADETFDKDEFWNRILQGSAVVSNETTKMCMAFGGGDNDPLPDANTCRLLCASLETACAFLVSIFLQLPKQQGRTLRRSVQTAVRDTLDAAIAFVENLQTIRKNGDARRLQLTGCTWESCEQMESLPRDNKSAVRAVISSNLELVNDAFSELQEAIDDEYSDNNSKEKWRDVAVTSQGLVKVVQSCMKKAGEAVLSKVETDDSQPSDVDRVAMTAGAISPATDDFVSSLYPPMCTRTVTETATALAKCLTCLLTAISESGCFGGGEPPTWMSFLSNAVEHNLKKVENSTRKSASDEV